MNMLRLDDYEFGENELIVMDNRSHDHPIYIGIHSAEDEIDNKTVSLTWEQWDELVAYVMKLDKKGE